jgi:hypothetical protein
MLIGEKSVTSTARADARILIRDSFDLLDMS